MWDVLQKINKLIMFKHTIFSVPFIFIALIIGANGWFGIKLLFFGILATISARNYAMAVNRYVDRDIDIKNPRTKDRIDILESIGLNNVLLFIIANAFIFIGSAYFINDLAFYLSFPILIILGAYSFFKRFSEYAHLILGLSLGLAPIAGAVAVCESIPAWSVFLAIGVMFWVAGFDILYSLQDMEFDKEEGLYSIPSRLGKDAAIFLSRMFHIFAVIFWILFSAYAGVGIFGWLGVIVSAGLLYYEHYLARDFSNIPKAFFEVNGYLSIIYLFFIILDKIL